jgi:thioesterase domain-containing protein
VDGAAVSAHHLGVDQRLQLVAHLVLADGVGLDRDEIREHLAGQLPAAAVPGVFVTVTELPTTAGGKLDRAALTVPDDAQTQLPRQRMVAARTGTEQRIAAVWQALLGLTQVGVHDDFFALGGHSLLAIRLTMELSRVFGTEIPLAHLYTAPTIAEQAVRLEARSPAGGHSVVPLGGSPGARPLVLVHPVGGTLFGYLELVGELRADVEAYGVQGRIGPDSGATDIAALAGRYADELVPVLGDRDPVVAGWSAGGVLAHELARALAERGIRIHRLVLIDSDPRQADDAEARRRDIATLDALRREVAEHGPAPLLRSKDADRLFATLGVDPTAVGGLDGPTVAALMTFWRDMFTGLAAHRPGVFAGPAELVVSAEEGGDLLPPAWRELTGPLTVTHADGDHFQLLRRPWVTAVAEVLRDPPVQSGSTVQTGD